AKFQDRWDALDLAMKSIDTALAGPKYGNPPRGKIGPAATKYAQAKDRVKKAVAANNFVAANRDLDELDVAVTEFQEAQREQFIDDRDRYNREWEPIADKVNDYAHWINVGKLKVGKA